MIWLRSEKSKSFRIISLFPPPVELIMFAHLSYACMGKMYDIFCFHEVMREDGIKISSGIQSRSLNPFLFYFVFNLICDEVKIFSLDSEWVFYDVFAPLSCWGSSETSESIYKTVIEEPEILNPCRIVNKQPCLLCY